MSAKAVICRTLGPPTVLRTETIPEAPVGDGQLRIAVKAAGVNFPDILMVAGGHQHKPPLPFIPGLEVAGEIAEIGPAVTGFAVGDRVMASVRTGGYADQVVAPATAVWPLPQPFDFIKGAAFLVAYNTAYVSLARRGEIQAGDTLLVHGAGGGVGLAAVELGAVLGARVIAIVGSKHKVDAVREAGAADVVLTDNGGWRERVKELTNGRGVDVVYDPVGGDRLEASVRLAAPGGRVLVVGFADGRLPTVRANLLLLKEARLIGVRAGEHRRRSPAAALADSQALLALAEAGRLTPRVHAVHPLEDFLDAMAHLSNRSVIGRVVLTP